MQSVTKIFKKGFMDSIVSRNPDTSRPSVKKEKGSAHARNRPQELDLPEPSPLEPERL